MSKMAAAAEAVGFTAGVIVYIWLLRPSRPWTVWALVFVVIVSFLFHVETLESVGLSLGALRAALRDWKIWYLLAAGAVAVLGARRGLSFYLLERGFLYFLWCVVQQIVYQTMVYRRLRAAFGSGWRTWIAAGILFAAAHAPNPVLVPATLLWGILSSRLFERRPSAPALALLQALFSSLLLWLTPLEWHRNFRVGPGYQVRPTP